MPVNYAPVRNFMTGSQWQSSELLAPHICSTDNKAKFSNFLSWLASCQSYYREGVSLSFTSSSGTAVAVDGTDDQYSKSSSSLIISFAFIMNGLSFIGLACLKYCYCYVSSLAILPSIFVHTAWKSYGSTVLVHMHVDLCTSHSYGTDQLELSSLNIRRLWSYWNYEIIQRSVVLFHMLTQNHPFLKI